MDAKSSPIPPDAPTLVPFVLTLRQNRAQLRLDDVALEPAVRVIEVEDAAWAPFFKLLNDTNNIAFGGDNMGMPLWVLLDCGLLPCAVTGFMVPGDQAPAALCAALGIAPGEHPWVPVSEYCACPTLEPGCVSGFSLQSQLPGQALGMRTKALAMLAYGAHAQIGVTQFDNPAIRVHSRLGPLQITSHRPAIHTHPQRSFIYRLELPDRPTLLALARGEAVEALPTPPGEPWRFDASDEANHTRLRTLIDAGRRVFITPPGWSLIDERPHLELVIA
jgi:hypothetical protein